MRALAVARNMQSDPRLLLGPCLIKSVGIAVRPLEIRIATFVHRNPDRRAGARSRQRHGRLQSEGMSLRLVRRSADLAVSSTKWDTPSRSTIV